jgi:hypothetical protein
VRKPANPTNDREDLAVSTSFRSMIVIACGFLPMLACGGGGSDGFDDLIETLQGCGIISEGRVPIPDGADDCYADCLADGSCEALNAYYCNEPSELEDSCALLCALPLFVCATGDEEIAGEWQCDGEPDCEDASDEADCATFICVSGEDIPAAWECDAYPDCEDESDEAHCGSFSCGSGEDVALWHECDGEPDCEDASDETGCAVLAPECPA